MLTSVGAVVCKQGPGVVPLRRTAALAPRTGLMLVQQLGLSEAEPLLLRVAGSGLCRKLGLELFDLAQF